ncbi:MAG: sensor histidine kinase [Romboutsia sp.]
MDYGNFNDTINETNFYNLLKYKINKYEKFDLVILADDYALEFGKKHRNTLFKNMPIVFLGANNLESAKKMVLYKSTYGILETVLIRENVDLISKLHSNKNIVAVVYDDSKNSEELKEFYSLESKYKNLNFKHISAGDMPSEEFKTKLNELSTDDVLLSIYSYNDNGGFKNMIKNIGELDNLTNIPKYNTLTFTTNENFAGGALVSFVDMGRTAGKIGKDILDGKVKVDSGFMDLRPKNIEIVSLLENLVLSIIPYAKNKDLEVIFDTDEEELFMCVDPDKIERIVLNLLSNAIKFSDRYGKITATVIRNKDILLFSIEDNGVGIDKENLESIFRK